MINKAIDETTESLQIFVENGRTYITVDGEPYAEANIDLFVKRDLDEAIDNLAYALNTVTASNEDRKANLKYVKTQLEAKVLKFAKYR